MSYLSEMRAAHDGAAEQVVPAFDALDLQTMLSRPDSRCTARVTLVAGGKAYEVTGAKAEMGGRVVRLLVTEICL